MNTNKLFLRLIVSPFVLCMLTISYSFALAKHFIGFLRWGGELIAHQKDERPTVNDLYKQMQELLKKERL